MSRFAKIKERLAAAGDEKWHKHKVIGWARGMAEYAVSPGDRGQFTKASADFIICSREEMEVLVALAEAVLDGATPREAADDLRELGPMHTTDEEETLAEAWDKLA